MCILRSGPLAGLILILMAASVAACTGCREPGEDVEAATVMAGFGFSWGVIFMLAIVFSMFSGLFAYMWRTIRAVDRGRGTPE